MNGPCYKQETQLRDYCHWRVHNGANLQHTSSATENGVIIVWGNDGVTLPISMAFDTSGTEEKRRDS